MKSLDIVRQAFICVAVAILTGCAGSQLPAGVSGAVPQFGRSSAIRISATAGYRIIFKFRNDADGDSPDSPLLNYNGTLYGETADTIFTMTRSGRVHLLYSFRGTPDGDGATGGLIYEDGVFYGMTGGGGAHCTYPVFGCGTVFKISPSGKEKVLYSFAGGADGTGPSGGLTYVNGTLYGTTSGGGIYGEGTVFSVGRRGVEHVLHSFGDGSGLDGAMPMAGVHYLDGTLYGTTYYGGSHGPGEVFGISPSGTVRTIYSFTGYSDGGYPWAGLIDVKGTLYGTTASGGAHCCSENGSGTVFSLTPSGVEKVLHSFGTGADGLVPRAALANVNGTLYGTTSAGGEYYRGRYYPGGTVFSVSKNGSEQVLHSFGKGRDGVYPVAGVTYFHGKLYGTTEEGGRLGCGSSIRSCGIIFALKPPASHS